MTKGGRFDTAVNAVLTQVLVRVIVGGTISFHQMRGLDSSMGMLSALN